MGTIEITDLHRTFQGVAAVDGISLTIDDGDFLVLLGPSGCGKTTLLRILAGLLEPTSGSIAIDGADVTRAGAKDRDLAMVFQSYALYPHLTVAKNLAFPLTSGRMKRRFAKAEIQTKVAEVARSLEIDHLLGRRPKELSGGQRQRVAVGRALVRDPRAYLMDEPLSNLDAKLRTATRHELTKLHRSLGATFVYVTHDQVEAMTMATKIAVLNQGRLEQLGTPTELYDAPATRFVAGFLGSPAMNLFEVELSTVAGHIGARAAGVNARLWPGQLEPTTVTLGVRPEHLRPLAPGDQGADLALDVIVETVENLGSEHIAYCTTTGGVSIALRGNGSPTLRAGTPVTLGADLARLHLFDQTGGTRLEWVADPAAPSDPATALATASA
ncbi:ABC transporter ATP-binding protein [Nocardia lasii]|uniref:ABC transporter ATP-binding protein n=1 Tax=Nocardia lasii TaxID=1616107 RepID=A0ABW1JU01_9NOCA